MDNLARLRRPDPRPDQLPPHIHGAGDVVRLEAGRFVVRTDAGELACRRAASCLLEPAAGDRVVVFADGDGAWVLAVLERPGDAPREVVVDGDARLVARDGALTVSAARGVRLESEAHVTAAAPRFRVLTERAEIAAKGILAVSERLDARVQRVTAFARQMDAFFDHVVARCKTAVRIVDETETVRAAHLDIRAEKLMAVRGENTVLTAEELVKVDGKQIHFG